MINQDSRMLKYKRAEQQVRKLISLARPGDRLPTERELAKMLDCNVLTVRKGMQTLVDEGFLSRRVGSGTFVSRIPPGETSEAMHVEYIGVLNHRDGGFYDYRLAQAIASEALSQNLPLRSVWTEDYGKPLLDTVADMARSGCKALIITWFPPALTDEVQRFVRASPLPPVLPLRLPGLEHLCFEDPGIFGKSAALEVEVLYEYFQRLGSTRVHFIGPDNVDSPVFREKVTAFVCHATKHGREPVFGLFGRSPEQALELARKYREYAGNLAIISYDDTHAIRFMTAMHKLGLKAPDDFRIVGHNESSAALHAEPPLSTVRENFEYIGHSMLAAAQGLAVGKIAQCTRSPNPKLVVRESCGGREVAASLHIPNLDIEFADLKAPDARAVAAFA